MKFSLWPICLSVAFGTTASLRADESMMEKPSAAAAAIPAFTDAGMALTPGPAKPLSRTEEILRRFDKNGDGKLDDDEKADAHEMMLQERMAKGVNAAAARNPDVYQALGLEIFNERGEAFAFIRRSADAMMRDTLRKRFDKNADGVFDDDFTKTAHDLIAPPLIASAATPLLAEKTDGNKIDSAEKKALAAEIEHRRALRGEKASATPAPVQKGK